MKIAYRPLFRVRLRHGFYASGQSRDFFVDPSPETRRRLADFALIFRPIADGFAVYGEIEPESTPPRLLKPIGADTLRLQFLLLAQNRYLANISSLGEHRPARSLFYFNNLRADAAGGRLHLGDSVAAARVGTAIRLAAAETLPYRFTAPVNAASLTLSDIFGNVVSSTSFRLAHPTDTLSEYRWNLRDVERLVSGRYLLSDDQGGSEALFYDPAIFASRPFAIVEIFSKTDSLTPDHSDRVPAAYRFLAGQELTGIGDYTIQLEPRSTTWRYNVIKKYPSNGVALNALAITGPITFSKTVQSDRAVFTSATPVALSESPQTLALEHGGTKVRDLPNPSATTFLQQGTSVGSFVSDMYVYV